MERPENIQKEDQNSGHLATGVFLIQKPKQK